MADIKEGDKVRYFNRDTNSWVPAHITEVGDTKKGFPVYGVILADGEQKWGYEEQIRK